VVLVFVILSASQFNVKAGDKDVSLKSANSQQFTVSGIIKDDFGQPMPGVNIHIEGTTGGTTTDGSGKYTVVVPNGDAVLIFTFIGYNEIKETVGGRTVIDVNMELSFEALDEIVVVGYGTQKKKDVTSAISVVDVKALTLSPVANVTNALMGIAPGVEVTNNSGKPGETATIRIRGTGSINSTDPLYVVDGIPMSGSNVNTSDIESIQVLKDAASCAIYGARGANGVIIITTKNGKAGSPKVKYNGYYGWEKVWKTLDLMNIEEWAAAITENNNAAGTTVPPLAVDIMNHINNGTPYTIYDGTVTDWQDEIFQTGAIMENNLEFSGGTTSGNYLFSVNQYKQEGTILDTPYERYSVRLNSNWTKGKFKFGEQVSFRYSKNEAEDNYDGRTVIEEAIKMTPNVPVYNTDNATTGGFSGYNNGNVGHDASNPVGTLMRRTAMYYDRTIQATVYGELQLHRDLTFRSTIGLIDNENRNSILQLKTTMPPKSWANTTLSEGSSSSYNWILEHMLTYHKVLGKHDITVMADMSTEKYKYHNLGGSGTTLQTDVNDVLSLLETGYAVTGGENANSRISYLGRIQYSFSDRYLITANIRRDGSSKFGPGNKWGNFPSASVAWRVSQESFMNSISAINNLKLRASYGIVGNDSPVLAYSYISTLSMNQNYTFGANKMVGAVVRSFVNPDLTWETVKSFDIGLDIGLFKGTIDASIDYYDKRTVDMLLNVPIPASSGVSGFGGALGTIRQNLGTVKNQGLEFVLTGRKSFRDLNLTVSGNAAYLIKNEVLDLPGNPVTGGASEMGNVTKTEVGHQVGEFYVYKMLGVFSTQADIDAYTHTNDENVTTRIQPTAQPGDVQFADLNNDGIISALDRDYFGSPIPKWTYGINLTADYKGFDLSLFMQGVAGNDIFSELVVWTQGMHNNFNLGKDALDRWQQEGDVTDVPRAVRNDPNGNIKNVSTRNLYSGNYMRLKNLTLGYTVPKKVTSRLKIDNFRIYATGRNLLTFTKYPYFDPEIGGTNTSRGIDDGRYPQARTIILGVQLVF